MKNVKVEAITRAGMRAAIELLIGWQIRILIYIYIRIFVIYERLRRRYANAAAKAFARAIFLHQTIRKLVFEIDRMSV